MDNSSVYVFSALFCITLFCFLAVRIYSIRHKSGNSPAGRMTLPDSQTGWPKVKLTNRNIAGLRTC